MYTIDASVWVNGFDQREPGHEISRKVLGLLHARGASIILPNLVLVEVAGAISRTRGNHAQAEAFAASLSRLPNVTFAPLDKLYAHLAQTLAAQHGLRGADAVYAAVAKQAASTLITLDNEHLTRLTDIITTCIPAAVLNDLMLAAQTEDDDPEQHQEDGQS